jgi:hypothetical protein
MKDVLVIVHDAGAAEIIGAYVRAHTKNVRYSLYAAGPAAKIFKRLGLSFQRVRDDRAYIARIIQKHKQASFALLGTGWMTTIDTLALQEARKAGLKSVVYLESWGDYRTRFGYPHRGWRGNVADELWCGDIHALKLVKKYFSGVSTRLVTNLYQRDTIRRVRALRRHHKPSYVLFLSRPNTHSDMLADELAENFSKRRNPPPLRIRLHPAEKTATWVDALVKKYRGRVRIIKSQMDDIARDFSGARAVIGRETVAMVISSNAGIRTICIVGKGDRLLVPFRAIDRTRNVTAATPLL